MCVIVNTAMLHKEEPAYCDSLHSQTGQVHTGHQTDTAAKHLMRFYF